MPLVVKKIFLSHYKMSLNILVKHQQVTLPNIKNRNNKLMEISIINKIKKVSLIKLWMINQNKNRGKRRSYSWLMDI